MDGEVRDAEGSRAANWGRVDGGREGGGAKGSMEGVPILAPVEFIAMLREPLFDTWVEDYEAVIKAT